MPAKVRVERRVSARPTTENEMELTFDDALRIARGCTDYGGGHRSNQEHYEIYQHGIKTVITALTAAANNGLEDTQVKALHVMGANDQHNRPASAGPG